MLFQFQLVRLKFFSIKDVNRLKTVSIPTGAIKMILTYLLTAARVSVSIPTGAIKIFDTVPQDLSLHQVSIPTGAIKIRHRRNLRE